MEKLSPILENDGRFKLLIDDVIPKISNQYDAKRVWIFGSVLRNGIDNSNDIDIAVEGVPFMKFYDFNGDISWKIYEVTGKSVDVVELEQDGVLMNDIVYQNGVVVYESI